MKARCLGATAIPKALGIGRGERLSGALDHRSITSTLVYTALAPNRFKDFWRE